MLLLRYNPQFANAVVVFVSEVVLRCGSGSIQPTMVQQEFDHLVLPVSYIMCFSECVMCLLVVAIT